MRRGLALLVLAVLAGSGTAGCGADRPAVHPSVPVGPLPPPASSAPVTSPPPVAAPAPAGLPRFTYGRPRGGFPADPAPASITAVRQGLSPRHKLAVYDAPGGRPRAFLPRSISGLPVTVPIVARENGWVGVLLPAANRRIGWIPATGWTPRPLPDQIVVRRKQHRMIWVRDGHVRASWTVAIGTGRTATPKGRTFVLGRTPTSSHVYAGLDALVLGAVPDDESALAPSLRGAHTAIHGWYRSSVFGQSVSNGCVRVPETAQRTLLHHLNPGTVVHVVD